MNILYFIISLELGSFVQTTDRAIQTFSEGQQKHCFISFVHDTNSTRSLLLLDGSMVEKSFCFRELMVCRRQNGKREENNKVNSNVRAWTWARKACS